MIILDNDRITSLLRNRKQTEEDISEFLGLYGDYEFTNDMDLFFKYGRFIMQRDGTQYVIEWDAEAEGFTNL